MKKILITFLFILCSCIKTEIINAPEPRGIDTVFVKPAKTHIDTIYTNVSDSTDNKVPMGFDPSVEDWDETIINHVNKKN